MANDTRSSRDSEDDENNRRKRLKSEESAKQLMRDSMETSRREKQKQHPHTVDLKKKMDARTYKSLLKLKKRSDPNPDFNEELKRREAISKIDGSHCGSSVSKPVDDREDGGENCTSHVDAAISPSPKCKGDNIAGSHVACSKRPRDHIFRNNPEVETHEVGKKFGKVVNNSDPASSRARLREGPGDERGNSTVPVDKVMQFLPSSTDSITHTLHKTHASASTFPSKVASLLPEVHMVKSEEETGLLDVQKSFDVLLNPEIPKLCEVLQLSEDVKVTVRRFLEYVMDNYEVSREPKSTLQAFQISLCWIAASLRECEIDNKSSLALAKQRLNFVCTEEEANNMHLALQPLKKRFKVTDRDFASDRPISKQEEVPNREEKNKEVRKSIKRIEKKRDKKIMKLNLKYQEEIKEFNKQWEEKSAKLEKDYILDIAIIRSVHSNDPVRSEELKRTEEKYVKVREELKQQRTKGLQEVEAKHLTEVDMVKRKAQSSLQDVNSWAQAELYSAPLSEAAPQCASMALHGEMLNYGEMHDGDAQASDNQDVLLQVEVAPLHSTGNGLTDQTNEEAFIEQVKQVQVSISTETHDRDTGTSADQDVMLQEGQTTDEEALPEHVEQLQSSKFTEIHVGDAEVTAVSGVDNQDVLLQVEVVPLHSTGNGPTDQTDDEEAFIEQVKQVQVSISTETHDRDTGTRENHDVVLQEGQTTNGEALPEHEEQLQSSKFTEIHVGDAEVTAVSGVEQLPSEGLGASQPFEKEPEVSENVDRLQQVEVSFNSTYNGSSDQTNADEALPVVVEQLQTSIIHVGNAEAGVNQDGPREVEAVPYHLADAGPTVRANHKEALIEGVQQLQMPPSSDSPVDHNHSDSHAASGVEQLHTEGMRASQPTNHEEALEGVQQRQISSFSDSSVDHHDVLPASGVEQLPSEGREASPPFDNGSGALDQLGIPSGEILELPPPNTDVTLGPHLHAVENDHQPSSQGFMPSQDAEASSQPVQGTAWVPNQSVSLTHLGMHPPLEGLGTYLPLNSAPQMASQLVTQPFCGDPLLKELDRVHKEKEQTIKIHEETKSSLKQEFEKQLQEAIAGIHSKYDNKFHDAESAFLLEKKELDTNMKKVLMNKLLADAFQSKCNALLRSQQGVPSNIMQQHIPPSRPACGPSHVTSSTSGQFVHHSSPPCSTTAAGPPLIAPITPPTGNLRPSSEIRAPAPHLQRFRPSSMPSTSISSVVPLGVFPIQHEQINLPTASPSVPHVPTTSSLIPHALLRYDCGRQAEVSGRTSVMLFDQINQPTGLPNLLPPLKFGPLHPSHFGSQVNGGGGAVANVASSGIATDVVCLSDDD